ncbi:hypothetical protein GGI42DRAFT_355930 [Trichoderma sp. SZMC 28013]
MARAGTSSPLVSKTTKGRGFDLDIPYVPDYLSFGGLGWLMTHRGGRRCIDAEAPFCRDPSKAALPSQAPKGRSQNGSGHRKRPSRWWAGDMLAKTRKRKASEEEGDDSSACEEDRSYDTEKAAVQNASRAQAALPSYWDACEDAERKASEEDGEEVEEIVQPVKKTSQVEVNFIFFEERKDPQKHSMASSKLSWRDIALAIVAEVHGVYPGLGTNGTDEALIGAGGLALGREFCKD